jgi:hypothetical protein
MIRVSNAPDSVDLVIDESSDPRRSKFQKWESYYITGVFQLQRLYYLAWKEISDMQINPAYRGHSFIRFNMQPALGTFIGSADGDVPVTLRIRYHCRTGKFHIYSDEMDVSYEIQPGEVTVPESVILKINSLGTIGTGA